MVGTVRNLEQLCGRLVSNIRRLEANWSVPSSSTGSSLGTRDDPLVLDDEEDEVVVRVEREDTVVPPPRAGTPFVARATMVTTLIEINKDNVDPNCQEHGIFRTFLFILYDFVCCFTLSTLFSLSFTQQGKTIRVLLIPKRSRAQCTTTMDNPFREAI